MTKMKSYTASIRIQLMMLYVYVASIAGTFYLFMKSSQPITGLEKFLVATYLVWILVMAAQTNKTLTELIHHRRTVRHIAADNQSSPGERAIAMLLDGSVKLTVEELESARTEILEMNQTEALDAKAIDRYIEWIDRLKAKA